MKARFPTLIALCAGLSPQVTMANNVNELAENIALEILMTWDCAIPVRDLGEVQGALTSDEKAFEAAVAALVKSGQLTLEGDAYRLKHEECV